MRPSSSRQWAIRPCAVGSSPRQREQSQVLPSNRFNTERNVAIASAHSWLVLYCSSALVMTGRTWGIRQAGGQCFVSFGPPLLPVVGAGTASFLPPPALPASRALAFFLPMAGRSLRACVCVGWSEGAFGRWSIDTHASNTLDLEAESRFQPSQSIHGVPPNLGPSAGLVRCKRRQGLERTNQPEQHTGRSKNIIGRS